jgi:hypothetical protein
MNPRIPLAIYAIAAVFIMVGGTIVRAQTLLWADDYVAPNGNFDNATTPTGELAASNVVQQSSGNESAIASDQVVLNTPMDSPPAGLRFQTGGNNSPPAYYNWSTGAAGAQIVAAGGMAISFNWTSPKNSDGNWLGFAAGINPAAPNGGADFAFFNSDNGLLLQNNGGTQLFDNGAGSTGNSFSVANGNTHQAIITYKFSSWADGTPVTMIASVDGTTIDAQSFTWNGTGGTNYMMMQVYAFETIGNFQITTLPVTSSRSLTVNAATVSRGDLILTGTGGSPGNGYTWLTTSNLSIPMAEWTTNTTGIFKGSGAFSNAIPIDNSQPAQFFRLRSP